MCLRMTTCGRREDQGIGQSHGSDSSRAAARLMPIVALIGIFTIGLIGGSVLTEEVFARPGLGKLMVGATTRRDYNLLQAVTIVYALIIVFVNIIVDIIYTWVDPRVRR